MALGAMFLVIIGFNYLKIEAVNPNSKSENNLSFEQNTDFDNDGLLNKEESYWNTDPNDPDTDSDGYLDGEEVSSGHDPLISSPNDLLPTDENLTSKISGLALAGIYEGSLKLDNPNFNSSVDNLATAIAGDAINSLRIDLSGINLKIIPSNNVSQQTYINKFSIVFEELLKTFIGQMFELEENLNSIGINGLSDSKVSESFAKSLSNYNKISGELSKMEVPQGWESNHLGVIKLSGELSLISQVIASGEKDPIKAVAGLNKIFQLWDILPSITEAYSKKIKLSNLDPVSTIFK